MKQRNRDREADVAKRMILHGLVKLTIVMMEAWHQKSLKSEILEYLKQGYYNTKVKVTETRAQAIAMETTKQGQNDIWKMERKKRITASTVVKMQATIKKLRKLKVILE